MATWYYYNENGDKVGPVRGRELKRLATQGIITPETWIENEEGMSLPAGNAKYLKFPEATPTDEATSITPLTPPSPPVVIPASLLNNGNVPDAKGSNLPFQVGIIGLLIVMVVVGVVILWMIIGDGWKPINEIEQLNKTAEPVEMKENLQEKLDNVLEKIAKLEAELKQSQQTKPAEPVEMKENLQEKLDEALKKTAQQEAELKQYRVDHDAMPADFRQRFQEIEAEIKEKGGFAVAGQITDEDGDPLPKGTFTVALCNDWRGEDTYRFDGGWYISRRETQRNGNYYNKLVVATFQHLEHEIPLDIEEGKVLFRNVVIQKAPKEKLTTLSGVIQDEFGQPAPNIDVVLTVSRSAGYFDRQTSKNAVSNANGEFSFHGILPQKYSFSTSGLGASSYSNITPNDDQTSWLVQCYSGGTAQMNGEKVSFTLFYPRNVTFDVVYQPDGSTDFTKENVKKGQFTLTTNTYRGRNKATWENPTGAYIRLEFDSERNDNIDDFFFSIKEGNLVFDLFYGGSRKGWYSLGEVDFDSVKDATPSLINTERDVICQLNHVYVIRTYDTSKYAKILIRNIEIVKPDGSFLKSSFLKSAEKPVEKAVQSGKKQETPLQFDLEAAPADFRKRFQEIEAEIKKEGGFAVAGQVIDKDNAALPKGAFTVALKYNDSNARDTYRYSGGWFITKRNSDTRYNKLVVATFQHLEQEIPLDIEVGKIITRNVILQRVPKDKLTTVSGVIRNEEGEPIPNVRCTLKIDRSIGYFETPMNLVKVTTDARGRYSFANIPLQKYDLSISSSGYMDTGVSIVPDRELKNFVEHSSLRNNAKWDSGQLNVMLYSPRIVNFEVVYQPDGSTDFTKENVMKGYFGLITGGGSQTASWRNPIGHTLYLGSNSQSGGDFYLELQNNEILFSATGDIYGKGVYDLGAIDFDSVSEAIPEKLNKWRRPDEHFGVICQLNHVYVIRTYRGANYAKLIIRSIEPGLKKIVDVELE